MIEIPSILRAQNIHFNVVGKSILTGIDLVLPAGKTSVIIGPNGCGKSTLLRILSRVLAPTQGDVFLGETSINHMPTRVVAQKLAFLPQNPIAPPSITVFDLIARGRTPHQSAFKMFSAKDTQAVHSAMLATNTAQFANQRVENLSGGQRQRVWIALVLAQETNMLLLDEPTSFLDLKHQLDILTLVQSRTRDGQTILAVLHDINLAARHADYIIAMRDGQIIKMGTPKDVITSIVMKDTFGLQCQIIDDPVTKTPIVIPH